MQKLLPLVVDLDGTLLKSDMLHECFWSAVSINWRIPILSIRAIMRGKAALKAYLSLEANIDASSMPYDNEVINYIQTYRAKGGRTALVTATNQVLADRIAKHLQIFDEVHGSDGDTNLKGPTKAKFLTERFGEGKFIYMGDAFTDLSIWRVSGKIVTVNATQSLQRQANLLDKPIEHLITTAKSLRLYFKAFRPHQWLKNILIFIPMLAAHQLNSTTFISCLLAFFAFSLVASSVYVLNDLLDLGVDRDHPRKRLRPFASGAIPIVHGGFLALGLLAGGFTIASFLNWGFFLIMGAYYVLTSIYSLLLKRKIVVDICTLAGLYTIRIVAGGGASGIELSVWLCAFSIFFFLSLAAIKRQAELIDLEKRGVLTAKGRGYEVEDLPIISTISLVAGYISVLILALYVNSANVQELYAFPYALWGICCVLLYWLTRMVLITHRGYMHDDPVFFILKDKLSKICFVVMFGFVMAGALL